MGKKKIKVNYFHVHTAYSERDGIAFADAYALAMIDINNKSTKYEIEGMTITEHGNSRSMCSARKELEKKNFNHILGCELYCTEDGDDISKYENRHHLVCIAASNGYANFCRLVTEGGHNKFQYKKGSKIFNVVTDAMVKKYGKGLILSTACIGGIIPQLILCGEYKKAKDKALYYASIVDKLYLEVQPHDTQDQYKVNKALVRMSEETGLPLIMGVDAHYILKKDKELQDALNEIKYKKIEEGKEEADKDDRPEYFGYLRTFEELEEYCIKHDIPLSALSNTGDLTNLTKGVDFRPLGKMDNMPVFPKLPPGYSEHDYLVELSVNSLNEKINEREFTNVSERTKALTYELRVIGETGFSGYFLILWDWAKEMRKRGILLGPGRGCFAPNMSVKLSDGTLKYIKDVVVGDKVINRFGDIDTVVEHLRYKANETLKVIEAYSGKRIVCTGDHKIMTRDGFKEAKNLNKDDFLVVPKLNTPIIKEHPLIDDSIIELGELVGLYLLNSNEDRKFDVSYTAKDKYTRGRLLTLINRFDGLNVKPYSLARAGHKMESIPISARLRKLIVNTIESMRENYIPLLDKGLLIGFFNKDITGDSICSSTSILAKDLIPYVALRNNIFVSTGMTGKSIRYNVATCSFEKLLLLKDIEWIAKPIKENMLKIIETDDAFMLRVRSSKSTGYKGYVHDLTVENDPSYNIDGVTVHNSAAGSLVNYVLGVTHLDPTEHGLLFSRFLNDERQEMPDIDIDCITRHRAESIEYFRDTYGKDKVSQIITFNTYGLKNVIKAAAELSGMEKQDAIKLAKGFDASYSYLKGMHEHPEDYPDVSPGAIKMYQRQYKKLLELMKEKPRLAPLIKRGSKLINSTGMHAAGVIISGVPMDGKFPTEKSMSPTAVLDLLSVDMGSVDDLKLLKVDDLGLASLQIIQDVLDTIGEDELSKDWYYSEDYSDQNVYDMLRTEGGTANIFQLSSAIPSSLMNGYHVTTLRGLSDSSSTNRPSGLEKILLFGNKSMMEIYCEYVKTGELVSLGLVEADELLKETGGTCLYQEQLQKLSQIVAGYTLGGADVRIRKTVGKKRTHDIPSVETEYKYGFSPMTRVIVTPDGTKEIVVFADLDGLTVRLVNDKVRFFDGDDEYTFSEDELTCVDDYETHYSHGLSPLPSDTPSKYNSIGAIRNGFADRMDGVNGIFEMTRAWSGYGFNLAHSISYSCISYKMAYLSYYFPIRFYCSVLRNTPAGSDGKLLSAIMTAKRRGITICPPDINLSESNYEVYADDDGNVAGIIAGFSNIHNIGIKSAPILLKIRDALGEVTSFEDFLSKIKEYKKLKSLKTVPVDKSMINSLILSGCFDTYEPNRYKLYKYYNTMINKLSKQGMDVIKGVEFLPEKRALYNYVFDEMKDEEFTRLVKIELEERYLTVPLSEHPLSNIPLKYLVDFDDFEHGDTIKLVGFITGTKKLMASNNKKFAVFTIELASSLVIEGKMWDCNSARSKKNMPRGIFATRGDFSDAEKPLAGLTEIIKTYEAKKKRGLLKATDAKEYNEVMKAYVVAKNFTDGKTYTPYLFKGKVNVYFGRKSVTLDSIKEITTSLSKSKKKKKPVENNVSTSMQIDDDI